MNLLILLATIAVLMVSIPTMTYSEHMPEFPQESGDQEVVVPQPLPETKGTFHANIPIPTPTPIAKTDSLIAELQYPDSSILRIDEHSVELTSNGDVEEITTWYSGRLKDLNFIVMSSTHSDDGNYLGNKLISSNSERLLAIDISQLDPNSDVRIAIREDSNESMEY